MRRLCNFLHACIPVLDPERQLVPVAFTKQVPESQVRLEESSPWEFGCLRLCWDGSADCRPPPSWESALQSLPVCAPEAQGFPRVPSPPHNLILFSQVAPKHAQDTGVPLGCIPSIPGRKAHWAWLSAWDLGKGKCREHRVPLPSTTCSAAEVAAPRHGAWQSHRAPPSSTTVVRMAVAGGSPRSPQTRPCHGTDGCLLAATLLSGPVLPWLPQSLSSSNRLSEATALSSAHFCHSAEAPPTPGKLGVGVPEPKSQRAWSVMFGGRRRGPSPGGSGSNTPVLGLVCYGPAVAGWHRPRLGTERPSSVTDSNASLSWKRPPDTPRPEASPATWACLPPSSHHLKFTFTSCFTDRGN